MAREDAAAVRADARRWEKGWRAAGAACRQRWWSEHVFRFIRDFAKICRAADKIVYSRTLEAASSTRTRIERDFDPEAVRELKAAAVRDLVVGGPDLAANAFAAGLVDECHLFLAPIVVRGGKRFLPAGVRLPLELLDECRFGNGTVYLRYRMRT